MVLAGLAGGRDLPAEQRLIRLALDLGLDRVALDAVPRTQVRRQRRKLATLAPMLAQDARGAGKLTRCAHGVLPGVSSHSMTILVRGAILCNRRSIAGRVMATQPAVGPKLGRARCRKTALPRPAIRGRVL